MNNSRKFAYGKPGLFRALVTIIPIAIVSILTSNACLAQIIPDSTLGNQNSRVITGVNIKGNGADLIEGGVQNGTNLFHSFAEFNINNGQRVYFANPTGVANILSRVTGNNPSNILGTLGVNGAANLFLLNPNGIIFGTNTQLDIQGSFLATTANSFQFPDGSEFSATNPQAPPLLTMSVPVGVQYGSQPAASITNQGNLVTGKDLTLNAGSLDLQGTLHAGGDIYLNSQNGKVDINGNITSKPLNGIAGDVTIQAVGDIHIFKSIEASSNSDSNSNNEQKTYNNIKINSTGGSVYLNGSKLDATNSGSGYAGFISIHASDKISILNGSKITSKGNNGFIEINTGSLSLNDASEINTDKNDGSEYAGFISINARNEISILNSSKITSKGNNGFIEINTGSLSLNDASEINTDKNDGSEYAGFISINARNEISILNSSKITSKGNNGFIEINTGSLSLNDTSEINTDNGSGDEKYSSINTNGQKDTSKDTRYAGAIIIDAKDNISILNNSKITSQGNYGFIDITTSSFSLNNSTINTSNYGLKNPGNAGYISINASDKISILNESNIFSQGNNGKIVIGSNDKEFPSKNVIIDNSFLSVDNFYDGNTGDINIYGFEDVWIKNSKVYSGKGTIESTENSKANGGTVNIESQGLVSLDNSQILSDVFSSDQNGNGGKINISARSLIIKNRSNLLTSTSGTGNAGDVTIKASDYVWLENSEISSSLSGIATGKAGNINIKTNFLTVDKGNIEGLSPGKGNGGNINITTNNLLLRRQSKISTRAGKEGFGGNGGSITINAKDGFVIAVPSEDSDIIANAFSGKGGTIEINANRILGFKKQENLNSAELRDLDKNHTSDISASSDVGDNGEVSLNTLSIDPSQGLVALPTNLVDTSRLIAQGCSSNSNAAKGQSEFVITGRGGLPPSPDDTLKPGAILPEWVINNTANNYSGNMTESNLRQLSSNTSAPLVEAVGMVRSANGDIVLTAQSTTATLLQSGLSTQACNVTQGNVR